MKKSKLKTTLIVLIILISLILCVNVVVYAAYALAATEVSYTKSDGTTTVSVKSALDELYTKVPTKEIGDEVKVRGEQFYVLDWNNDSDTVNLIAKYNLNSNGDAQSSTEVDCKFSSTNYWSFTSSPFNLNDYIGFTSTDALGKAKNYGRSIGAVSSRLLSYEEANALHTKSVSNPKIKSMYDNGQNYWLGSASNGVSVWYKNAGTALSGMTCFSNNASVRPVITVLKSNIS